MLRALWKFKWDSEEAKNQFFWIEFSLAFIFFVAGPSAAPILHETILLEQLAGMWHPAFRYTTFQLEDPSCSSCCCLGAGLRIGGQLAMS